MKELDEFPEKLPIAKKLDTRQAKRNSRLSEQCQLMTHLSLLACEGRSRRIWLHAVLVLV